ncbi:hypothetical protein [Sporolactobacillus sp. THM19-2]|uniref:hypothetical protein n=1 Tax=Sporolactobacillus sp. THM19-2 TaxID=2511171 RepID=UPI00101EA434|nr:hypothetical protein [Sporolactobacillus sp. THM19-2]RYL93929.1 hypothetical protein EWH91_01905 [Sporolactobacillus sp. THM19-2]
MVARTNWYANQAELQLGEFRNGDEIKEFVEDLGFEVTSEHLIQSETEDTQILRSVDYGWYTLYEEIYQRGLTRTRHTIWVI